ncbi:MAG: amino acid adenylation domain-containing protein, partial [Gordonia sp. (in: high G+C Gram-positive bacteria)]
ALGSVALGSVRQIFTSGEALTPAVAQSALAEVPSARLHNLYGPTEAAVDVTSHEVTVGEPTVPIGRPVPNTTTWVLDRRLRPVPPQVAGELYLGGVQVARGYAGRADLTAERFIADPFGAAGARLYRTGDRVRWSASGELEYLGRTDFQVKLRGQRIELGEIEAVLAAVPGVVHAAVTVAGATADEQQLVGYLAGTVDLDAVREVIARALPEYMWPTAWVVLDEMPLNAAGKTDRRALPAPESASTPGADGVRVPPASDLEETIAAVFADVLGVAEPSVTTSFFDLGGNSLSATRVVARVGAALDTEVGVRELFEAPSVRELARRVTAGAGAIADIEARPRPAHIPLSFAQQRMWFINQFDTASTAYNIPLGLRLTGPVSDDALIDALVDVVGRHEVLRTVYPTADGRPHQRILAPAAAAAALDWSFAPGRAELLAIADRGFDVTADLPLRGRIWRDPDTGPDTSSDTNAVEILLVCHHIAFDGESAKVLARDLVAAYRARVTAGPAAAPLAVQYADFAIWQHETMGRTDDPDSPIGRQFAHWVEILDGLPAVTDLPMDRPRPAVLPADGERLGVPVPADLADALRRTAAQTGLTPFMVCHAALAVTVSRLAATDDVVIGAPVAGRGRPELDDLIGMFVNTLVLRTPVAATATVAEFLRGVRDVDLDAFAHADVAFEQLVDTLAPERSTAHAPLAQIAFTYAIDEAAGAVTLPDTGVTVTPLDIAERDAKFDLTMGVVERVGDGDAPVLSAEFLYARALFDEPTIRRLADTWLRVLTALTGDPEAVVGDIDLLSDAQRRELMILQAQLVAAAEETDAGGGGRTVPEILADRTLDLGHPALITDDETLSYAEFEARTNQLARVLVDRGVGPETVVAVAIARSITSVIATWAVFKACGAYLPVDPTYPDERIRHMLTDSGAALGLTTTADRAVLSGGESIDWLVLDDPQVQAAVAAASADAVTATDRHAPLRRDHLAYLIYTSGSTGLPKAVAIAHRGIADLVGAQREITSGSATRVLHVASPSFDASILEMFWAIASGHTLVISPADTYGGPDLVALMARHRVTDAIITPTVLATMDPAGLHHLKHLATGGEACPPELVDRWAAEPGRTLYNFYGPTETTVWATVARSLPGVPVTIGRPLRGFTAHILDRRLNPVPHGVVGELYLSAPGVARGYLHRAGLTATRVVADPFGAPGDRLYATGD